MDAAVDSRSLPGPPTRMPARPTSNENLHICDDTSCRLGSVSRCISHRRWSGPSRFIYICILKTVKTWCWTNLRYLDAAHRGTGGPNIKSVSAQIRCELHELNRWQESQEIKSVDGFHIVMSSSFSKFGTIKYNIIMVAIPCGLDNQCAAVYVKIEFWIYCNLYSSMFQGHIWVLQVTKDPVDN